MGMETLITARQPDSVLHQDSLQVKAHLEGGRRDGIGVPTNYYCSKYTFVHSASPFNTQSI